MCCHFNLEISNAIVCKRLGYSVFAAPCGSPVGEPAAAAGSPFGCEREPKGPEGTKGVTRNGGRT